MTPWQGRGCSAFHWTFVRSCFLWISVVFWSPAVSYVSDEFFHLFINWRVCICVSSVLYCPGQCGFHCCQWNSRHLQETAQCCPQLLPFFIKSSLPLEAEDFLLVFSPYCGPHLSEMSYINQTDQWTGAESSADATDSSKTCCTSSRPGRLGEEHEEYLNTQVERYWPVIIMLCTHWASVLGWMASSGPWHKETQALTAGSNSQKPITHQVLFVNA